MLKVSLLYLLLGKLMICTMIVPSGSETFCEKQTDCYNNDYKCGFCVDNEKPSVKQSLCFYPFDYMFESGKECLVRTDCNCSPNGECTQLFASKPVVPSCHCKAGFFGDQCQFSIPPNVGWSVPRQVAHDFISSVNPFQYDYVKVYVTGEVTKSIAVFLLTETADGFFMKYLSSTGTHGEYFFFPVTLRFSYKFIDEPNHHFLKLGDKVLGYLSSYRVAFIGRDLPPYSKYISDKHFKVLVSYQNTDLTCVPVVKILDCASYRTLMVKFKRSDPIRLQSSVFFVADGRYISSSVVKPECSESVTYKWTIWKTIENEAETPVFEVYAKKSLTFKPFHLENGYYRVLFEVEKVQSKPSKNYAYCYFQVELQHLIAVIEGGRERTIIRKYGLELDGRQSYDPNMPRDKQSHLMATWSCIKVSDPKHDICSVKSPVSEINFVTSESLEYGALYHVTLTVSTDIYKDYNVPLTAHASANITVADKDVDLVLYIVCLLNCKEKVINNQVLYLKAGSNKQHVTINCTWTYYEEGQTFEIDATNISVKGIPNHMIMVKENALAEGKKYTIVGRSQKMVAKYSFETEQVNFEGNCSVTPLSGVRGFTLFDIVCENFTSQFTFEFYDKYPEEAAKEVIFNGRMLGTPYTGKLEKVKITRGIIVAYIIDSSGLFGSKKFEVTLSEWNVTQEIINEIFQNLTELANSGERPETLRYISFIPDIVPNDMDKSVILDRLLFYVSRIPVNNLADMKLTTSTLTNVLQTLNRPTQLGIDSDLMKDVTTIIQKGTKLFSNLVGKGESLQGMSPNEIKLVAVAQLNCVKAALSCRDPQTENIDEFKYDSKVLNDLIESSKLVVETMDLVQDTLTYLQASGQPPTQIASDNDTYVMEVAKNDKEYNLTNYFNKKKNSSVLISNSLMKRLEKELSISMQVTNINDNIFWWCKSDVKSNFVSVSLAKETKNSKLVKVEYLDQSIFLSLGLNPNIISTKFTDNVLRNDNQTDKEVALKIHRLDPAPKSLLSLKFLFPETNGSLLVLVFNERRPDSNDVEKFGQNITNNSPYYKFGTLSYHERQSFLYVGLLPAEDNIKVSYTFEVNTTLCQYWTGGQWSSSGCKINSKNDLEVTCNCAHLSIFAAAFPVPPQEIDPFADAKLFLTVFDNPVVVSFVVAVILLYLLLCFWARWKDKIDRRKRNVIVLDDNYPSDSYPYLIAVYTSSRFNSGTTAHVGIKINGELADSRSHILSSKDRKVLRKNYDDWFLIYCPEYLGLLKSIHIWHDNAGSSPDWFSSRIVIYDLTKSIQAVFVIDQWLALRVDEYPEAKVMPATVVEVKSVKRIFVRNFVLGLRQLHSLLSIVLRHPRSEISRLQRISVYMCLFMTAMLCSIMFYNPSSPADVSNNAEPDDSQYQLGTRDLLISVESLLITLVLTFFVLFAFKRSYTYTKERNSEEERFTILQRKSLFDDEQKPVTEKRFGDSIYGRFAKFVTKMLKSSPLAPAQLPKSQGVVKVRKKWLIFAWILCITVIFICSYLVMLYGLKLGKVKSIKWLSSVFMTLAEDIMIIGPAKIIFYALVLSTVFQKICEEDTHTVNYRDAMALETPFDKKYLEKLTFKRNHPMYAPLEINTRLKMIKKKEVTSNWWTVVDFCVALVFVFVLSIVVFKLWSSHYHSNSCIVKFMTEPDPILGPEGFFGIKYIEEVNDYLLSSYTRTLYRTFWYNNMSINYDGDPDHDIYWSEDYTYTLVGVQNLRQLRVIPINCDFKYIKTDKKCIPHYSEDNEDIDAYAPGWQAFDYPSEEDKNSPWIHSEIYNEESESSWLTMYRMYGSSGILYKSGGYMTRLGPEYEDVIKSVSELINNHWQDLFTKVVVLEFTIYNVNLDLLSQVTVIVEYFLAGAIQLKAEATTIESKMKIELWNCLFIVFIIYYFIRSGYLINRLGFVEYLKSARNRSRLIVVTLGVICIALAFVHYYNSTSYFKEFVNSGPETYFNFDVFLIYFSLLQIFLSILLAVAMIRAMGIFRGGRSILNHTYTFLLSINSVIWMLIIVFIFSLAQLPMFILLNIFQVPGIQEMLLDPKSYKYFKIGDFQGFHIQVIFFVKTVLYGISVGFFIIIFLHFSKIAKTYKQRSTDKFNIVVFVINGLKRKKNEDNLDLT